ncbi:MAG: NosD domain-containing protein [Candidatus Bathyarchaeia archaeon]|jgi:hypothetical protein
MSYPRKYPPSGGGGCNSLDWNAMVDRIDGFTASGVFRSQQKFIIDFDGTDYYACNAYQTIYGGASDAGGVDGSDPTAVIQACLTAATTGGLLFLKNNQYEVTKLTVNNPYIHLVGETLATELKLADGTNDDLLLINYGANDVQIENLYLNGNKANNATGLSCIHSYAIGTRINNCRITGAKAFNIHFQQPESYYTGLHWVTNCSITYADDTGISLNGNVYDCFIIDNDVGANAQGLYSYANASHKLIGNNFWGSTYTGVKLLGATGIKIADNRIDYNGTLGAWIESCENVDLDQNNFYMNSASSSNSYDAVHVKAAAAYPCNHINFRGNQFGTLALTETQRYSISTAYETGASELGYWIITDNDFIFSNTSPTIQLYNEWDKLVIDNNMGFKTRQQGISLVADGGTVAHHLAYTPTLVVANGSVAGEMVTTGSYGTSNFTVAIKKHDNSAGTQQYVSWIAYSYVPAAAT